MVRRSRVNVKEVLATLAARDRTWTHWGAAGGPATAAGNTHVEGGTTMKQLQKVLWTKGVLLNPQHLQMQDRYLEHLLEFRLSALTFCPWGFSRLEIDREALAAGVLAITSAAGLFGDGLVFDVGGADPAPAPLPLAEHWRADQTELIVHLAIPEHRPGSASVSAGGSERDTRYVAEVVLRRDENTGLAEKPVQVARNNLRLVAEGESVAGLSALPVARVRRTGTGALELDASYVPPLLNVSVSSYLQAMARRIVELLAAKSSGLGGMRRQRNVGLADFGVSDVANFWLLYTVNSHLPRFRHLHDSRASHPAALYSAMAELSGALMTFATGAQPADLPPYDHHDLTGCFTRLDALLRTLLESAVPEKFVSLPLRGTEPSVYATALDEERYLTAPQLYLAVAAAAKPEEVIRRVPQLFKVSSADRIEGLIRRALPGVALRYVPEPPGAVPLKLNFHYFAVERTGEDWDAIRLSRHLAAYVPAELPDVELELIVLLG
jgi:type VI secretion system protein ImpJ